MNAILVPFELNIDIAKMYEIAPKLVFNPDTVRYSNALILPTESLAAEQVEWLKSQGAKEVEATKEELNGWPGGRMPENADLSSHGVIRAQTKGYVCAINAEHDPVLDCMVITCYTAPQSAVEYVR